MRITFIETIPVRVPIRERPAIRAKGGVHPVSPFLLVNVHTEGFTACAKSPARRVGAARTR